MNSHSKCDIEILAIMAFSKFKFSAAGNFEGEALNEIWLIWKPITTNQWFLVTEGAVHILNVNKSTLCCHLEPYVIIIFIIIKDPQNLNKNCRKDQRHSSKILFKQKVKFLSFQCWNGCGDNKMEPGNFWSWKYFFFMGSLAQALRGFVIANCILSHTCSHFHPAVEINHPKLQHFSRHFFTGSADQPNCLWVHSLKLHKQKTKTSLSLLKFMDQNSTRFLKTPPEFRWPLSMMRNNQLAQKNGQTFLTGVATKSCRWSPATSISAFSWQQSRRGRLLDAHITAH